MLLSLSPKYEKLFRDLEGEKEAVSDLGQLTGKSAWKYLSATDKKTIEDAVLFVRELFRTNAGGHDLDHTLRVFRNTLLIAEKEPDCDVRIAALAALLHDVDDHKLFTTKDNANARKFLKDSDVPKQTVDRICKVINSVSFSRNKGLAPETPEGRAVQDADRLDALGAVGIARTFAYGGEHGRPMQESVQHFYDKLLKLKSLMNTETGKRMAEKRHVFLKEFLKEYYEEAGDFESTYSDLLF